jgi:hypothetical protein
MRIGTVPIMSDAAGHFPTNQDPSLLWSYALDGGRSSDLHGAKQVIKHMARLRERACFERPEIEC